MIHIFKKSPDISSPNPGLWVFSKKILSSLYRSQQTFSFPARPGVGNKSFVINPDEIIINQTMNDLIADWAYRYFSAFVIRHNKFPISSMTISSVIEIKEKPI